MSMKPLSADGVKRTIEGRATIYRFLSRGFSTEVDEPFVECVLKLQPVISNLAASSESEEFKTGSKLLDSFVDRVNSQYNKDKNAFLRVLAAEYASLFLNVGRNPVHLVESVYLGENHLLYEKQYFDTIRIYQIYGFKKKASFHEPEDHVSIELEFMAQLCDLTALSIEQGKEDYTIDYLKNQREFLETHLARWVSQLAKNLKRASRNDFYLALADLLDGFVMTDRLLVLGLVEGP
jgi:TorA maturation chaperone TorD